MGETVTSQPVGYEPGTQAAEAEFTHGLFDCFGDCIVCIKTLWCPCLVSCDIAEGVDENKLLYCIGFLLLPTCIAAIQRQQVRNKYAIEGTIVKDCLLSWCCLACVLCQSARQVKD